MGETNTTATSDITPTEADLQVDLCIMLQQVEHDIAWLKVQPKPEGAVFDPKDLARSMEGTAAALRRAIAAEAELKQLKTSTYCAYCGHTEPIDGDGERIAEHIRTCEKHPMRAVEARVKELEQTLLQGVLQLKGMRDEVDRLLQEAEEFQKQMEAKGE